jgi:hypothetical protein
MEKLTAERETNIKRMSDVRLTVKWTQADWSIKKLEGVDRAAMINAWDEMVATGKDKLSKETVEAQTIGSDAEVERKRFDFEMWNYED